LHLRLRAGVYGLVCAARHTAAPYSVRGMPHLASLDTYCLETCQARAISDCESSIFKKEGARQLGLGSD